MNMPTKSKVSKETGSLLILCQRYLGTAKKRHATHIHTAVLTSRMSRFRCSNTTRLDIQISLKYLDTARTKAAGMV